MNSTPRQAGGDAEDPWEDLAEQLFGTTPGKEHTAGHDTPARPSTERAAPERSRAERKPAERPASPSRDNPLASIAGESAPPAPRKGLEALLFDDADEQPVAAAASDVAEPVSEERGASFAAADSAARAPQPKPSTSSSPQDSYWDLLANWNWDEGDSSKSR
ncbi:MAG: hypothetical protein ACK5F7_10740, partial [Planctomycetaceae bacterium]